MHFNALDVASRKPQKTSSISGIWIVVFYKKTNLLLLFDLLEDAVIHSEKWMLSLCPAVLRDFWVFCEQPHHRCI